MNWDGRVHVAGPDLMSEAHVSAASVTGLQLFGNQSSWLCCALVDPCLPVCFEMCLT